METQIFTCKEGWDTLVARSFLFANVTLVVDVGVFKAGTSFDSAKIDYGESPSVSFYGDDGDLVAKFALSLKIGDAISA